MQQTYQALTNYNQHMKHKDLGIFAFLSQVPKLCDFKHLVTNCNESLQCNHTLKHVLSEVLPFLRKTLTTFTKKMPTTTVCFNCFLCKFECLFTPFWRLRLHIELKFRWSVVEPPSSLYSMSSHNQNRKCIHTVMNMQWWCLLKMIWIYL